MTFGPLPSTANSDSLTCTDPTIPTDGKNLVIKVICLLLLHVDQINKENK